MELEGFVVNQKVFQTTDDAIATTIMAVTSIA